MFLHVCNRLADFERALNIYDTINGDDVHFNENYNGFMQEVKKYIRVASVEARFFECTAKQITSISTHTQTHIQNSV